MTAYPGRTRRCEKTPNGAPARAGGAPAEAGSAFGRPTGGEMEGTGKGDAER
jgi:hypothetical protein